MLMLTIRHNGYFVIKTPAGEVTVWNMATEYGRVTVGIDAPREINIVRDDVEWRSAAVQIGSADRLNETVVSNTAPTRIAG